MTGQPFRNPEPVPAAPTGLWAVDRIAALDGAALPAPARKGVFCSAEVARAYVSGHHGPYPWTAFRVAALWQERRADGTRCMDYVPGDAA